MYAQSMYNWANLRRDAAEGRRRKRFRRSINVMRRAVEAAKAAGKDAEIIANLWVIQSDAYRYFGRFLGLEVPTHKRQKGAERERLAVLDGGITALWKATSIYPSDGGAWYLLGVALRTRGGRTKESRAVFRRATALNPNTLTTAFAQRPAAVPCPKHAQPATDATPKQQEQQQRPQSPEKEPAIVTIPASLRSFVAFEDDDRPLKQIKRCGTGNDKVAAAADRALRTKIADANAPSSSASSSAASVLNLAPDPRPKPDGVDPSDGHLSTCSSCAARRAYRDAVLSGRTRDDAGRALPPVAVRAGAPHLFVDEFELGAWTDVELCVEPPAERRRVFSPPPLKRPPGHMRSGSKDHGFYGTVVRDRSTGKFRMYFGQHIPHTVESSDGFVWSNLQEHTVRSASVSVTPLSGDDGRKFVMGYSCSDDHGGQLERTCVATSCDGHFWQPLNNTGNTGSPGACGPACTSSGNTVNTIYFDHLQNKYRLVNRREFGTNVGWREIRGTRFSSGGPSLDDEFVERSSFYLDRLEANDDGKGAAIQKTERYQHQIYAFSVDADALRASNVFVGLACILEWPKLLDEPKPPFAHDVMNTYLATSRDGVHWDLDFVYEKTPLVPRGAPGSFDHGIVFPASRFVTHGGFHWLYYEGRGDARHSHRRVSAAHIGLARFERNRLIGIRRRGSKACGAVITRPFVFDGEALEVSVASADGSTDTAVVVELLAGSPGDESCESDDAAARWFGVASLPIRAHAAAAPVTWPERGSALHALHGQMVRVKFYVCGGARLFGFTVVPEKEEEGDDDGFSFL